LKYLHYKDLILETCMSSNSAYVNNIKDMFVNEFDFDEDKELENLAHSLKLMRLGKKLRETNKLDKDYCVSDKTTHKKSKNPKKWE
jgi:hypothetical protein